MFIGSDGMLGVITRAMLKLQARPVSVSTAFCGCPDFAAALALLQTARATLGPALTSFELMWPGFYDFMMGALPGLRRPLADRHGMYVVIEASGFDAGRERELLQDCLAGLMDQGAVTDAVVAGSEREARELWAVRESVSEYGNVLGRLTAFDIGLPTAAAGDVTERLGADLAARWPDVIALFYGHIGDSYLHLVINVPSAGEAQPSGEISRLVYGAIGAAGGTISAEHGIGLLKKACPHLSRTPAELALMARLKAALDPNDILNTGKVLTRA